MAEEADRGSHDPGGIAALGVAKVDVAFKAVKDDVYGREDGRLVAQRGRRER